jgi:hypothetical protein
MVPVESAGRLQLGVLPMKQITAKLSLHSLDDAVVEALKLSAP